MVNEVITAIAQRLDEAFGDSCEIHQEELLQGFEAPCFFILTLLMNQKQIIQNRYYRECSFNVHYFPKSEDAPNAEINEISDRLWMALEYISLSDGLIRGTAMRREVQDSVLHFFVNYDGFFLKETVPEVFMGALAQKQKLKGG